MEEEFTLIFSPCLIFELLVLFISLYTFHRMNEPGCFLEGRRPGLSPAAVKPGSASTVRAGAPPVKVLCFDLPGRDKIRGDAIYIGDMVTH